MSLYKLIYTTLLLLVYLVGQGQLKDSVVVNKLIDESKTFINSDPTKALELADEAKRLAKKINFKVGEASALKNIGLVYYFKGNYIHTLDYWNQSLKLFEESRDTMGMTNLHGNIGAVFYKQGDEANALKHHLESLRLAEKSNNKLRIFFALNNIGGIYFEKKATWDKALDYLLKAAPIAEEVNDKESLGLILGNIGAIYFEIGKDAEALNFYNKALKLGSEANAPFAYNGLGKLYLKLGDVEKSFKHHNKALQIAENLNELHLIPSYQGIANTYIAKKDFSSALKYYNKAEQIAESQKAYPSLKEIYDNLSSTYASIGNYSKAYLYQSNLNNIKDTLYNVATQKKLNSLQFEFDLGKKEGEISLLTKDKALKDEELRRQRFAKNAFMVGLILIFIITYVIFRNYRNKVKVNKVLDQQKLQIEQLLLNILPVEVANELKTKGRATPMNYDHVSVLFTDFKGFTLIADKLSPEQLVLELNACFEAFDDIMIKNGIEKIKTVGDAYMCAGGIPIPDDDHPFRIVKAALDIKEYISKTNEKRKESGQELWEIRIGIHVGPLTAGVVGKKKYAYDIWGSTVNIASRMESSGVPGQVNISAATYEIVKDKYNCVYRGKIYAKNVGDVDMYLIDSEKGEEGKIFSEKTNKEEVILKIESSRTVKSNLLQ